MQIKIALSFVLTSGRVFTAPPSSSHLSIAFTTPFIEVFFHPFYSRFASANIFDTRFLYCAAYFQHKLIA